MDASAPAVDLPVTPPAVPTPIVPDIPGNVPVQTPAPAIPTYEPAKGKFFDGINASDVIIGALVITTLVVAIWYFRDRAKEVKTEYPVLRSDVDQLKDQMSMMNAEEN